MQLFGSAGRAHCPEVRPDTILDREPAKEERDHEPISLTGLKAPERTGLAPTDCQRHVERCASSQRLRRLERIDDTSQRKT